MKLPGRLWLCGMLLSCLLPIIAVAHPDLDLQIEQLTAQLTQQPGNTALLLRRASLHSAHQDWELARVDFARVRQIDPDNRDVDWLEGRMETEAGRLQAGIALLDRFLGRHPGHGIALQNRAQAYLWASEPLLAARDYEAVIRVSTRPGPSLYAAGAEAYIAAGGDHHANAAGLLDAGLGRYPAEVTLTGLATDLALAVRDVARAKALIAQLPAPVRALAQWQTRLALLDCEAGREAEALARLDRAQGPAVRQSTPYLPEQWLQALRQRPDAETCAQAALAALQNR